MSYLPDGIAEIMLFGCDAAAIRKYWLPGPGDVCWDVGFGPGPWSVAALVRGAAVYAFDHYPVAVESFTQTLNYRALACCVVPAALWDSSGWIKREPPANNVPCFSMDDFCAVYKTAAPGWVNMDCEGAELKVVRGGRKTLAASHPRLIIEVHPPAVDRAELRAELESLGYNDFTDDGEFLVAR